MRFLRMMAGHDKLVLGSDYPFPIRDWEPVKIIDGLGLGYAERSAIVGATAARLFNVKEAA